MNAFRIGTFVAIVAAALFLGYSVYLKDHCDYRPAVLGAASWGQGAFGAGHGDCVKKAWWRP